MNFAMSFLNDCISKGPTVAELLIVETKNQEPRVVKGITVYVHSGRT